MEKTFDIVIIGGGVAGMTAAIYAKRRGKNVCIIEKFSLGGQVNTIPKIENYPGFAEVDGITLSQNFSAQIERFGIEVAFDDIEKVNYSGSEKVIFGKKNTYRAKSVIIATGLSYVELGLNESEFLGRGVSYCAVCDANFFKNRPVCVASKNGSGLKDAFVLAEVCSRVTVLDSGDLSAYAHANKNKKIEVLSNCKITKLRGQDALIAVEVEVLKNSAKNASDNIKDAPKSAENLANAGKNISKNLENAKTAISKRVEERMLIKTSGLFVALGKKPNSNVFGGVKVDKSGFIITDENMRTSISGVFAVGDVRSKPLKQIVTACADGAIAGQNA